jgi:hypothetical protein
MFEETSDPKPKESTIFDALKCSNLPEETLSRVEDTQQILDLEKHVKSMKRQEITAMEKAKRSAELEAKISCLEAQVSSLSAKIAEFTNGDPYMTELFEEASKKLQCKFHKAPEYFLHVKCIDAITHDAGTCLDAAAEKFGRRTSGSSWQNYSWR